MAGMNTEERARAIYERGKALKAAFEQINELEEHGNEARSSSNSRLLSLQHLFDIPQSVLNIHQNSENIFNLRFGEIIQIVLDISNRRVEILLSHNIFLSVDDLHSGDCELILPEGYSLQISNIPDGERRYE